MTFSELAANRYSVRKYEARKVEVEKLQSILEAARVAPSASNKRPIQLIVVQSGEGMAKINKTANTYMAPLVIIVCGNTKTATVRPVDGKLFADVDTSIVTDHMMLQASDLGLGSCWIAAFNPKIIKEEFDLPDELEATALLAVGYAADEPLPYEEHAKKWKSLEEFVAYEKL